MPDQPIPKSKLRWYQYRLRTLLLLVTAFAVFMSWFTVKMQQAKRQKEIVDKIQYFAAVSYDYQIDSSGELDESAKPLAPAWLVNWLGIDFFSIVVCVEQVDKGCYEDDIEELSDLSQLKKLSLGCNLTDQGLERLLKLKNLQTLDITSSEISRTGIEQLKNLTKLKQLTLSVDNISDAEIEPLKNLTQLENLTIEGNQLSDAALEYLKNLKQLVYLNIRFEHFSGIGLRQLKGLNLLQELQIHSSDKLIDEELENLADLPQLQTLEIGDSQITDASLLHLKGLSHLKILGVYSGQTTNAGEAELKKILPNASINEMAGNGGMGGMGMF